MKLGLPSPPGSKSCESKIMAQAKWEEEEALTAEGLAFSAGLAHKFISPGSPGAKFE